MGAVTLHCFNSSMSFTLNLFPKGPIDMCLIRATTFYYHHHNHKHYENKPPWWNSVIVGCVMMMTMISMMTMMTMMTSLWTKIEKIILQHRFDETIEEMMTGRSAWANGTNCKCFFPLENVNAPKTFELYRIQKCEHNQNIYWIQIQIHTCTLHTQM